MNVIGRKNSPSKHTLVFIILCKKEGLSWYSSASIEELSNAFKQASKVLHLIPVFPCSKLDSYESSYLNSLQYDLSNFFSKIRYREDVLCFPLIQQLLLIPQFPLIIEYLSTIKISEIFTMTSFCMVPSNKCIISCGEYISMFKGIGKLWSLIEVQSLGEIAIIGLDDVLYKIGGTEVEEQIKCLLWLENSFAALFGMESGNVLLVRFRLKLSANSKGIFDGDKLSVSEKIIVKLHLHHVKAMCSIDELVVSISAEGILKISRCKSYVGDQQGMETIGGGSLKQRLGSDKLSCLQTDAMSKKICLGTEQGKIFVYGLENASPKFLYTFTCENHVKEIEINWGIIFIAAGASIMAYPDSQNTEILAAFHPNLEGVEVSTIRYAREKDMIFAGYSVRYI